MAQWDEYSEKQAPADEDTMMIKDNSDVYKSVKRLTFGNLKKWMVKKLTGESFVQLKTEDKTLVGAINEIVQSNEEKEKEWEDQIAQIKEALKTVLSTE